MLEEMAKAQEDADQWAPEVGGPLKVHGYQATVSAMGLVRKQTKQTGSSAVRLGAKKDAKGQTQLFKIETFSVSRIRVFSNFFEIWS